MPHYAASLRLVVCLLACRILLLTVVAHAQAIDGLQYIASYDDLIMTIGPNAALGRQHYETYGRREGRQPDRFDEARYLANYADLRAAFGADRVAATVHYIRYGFAEGRTDRATPPACPARRACRKRVTSAAALADALATTGCGCEIVLADGSYAGDFVLARQCPIDQPLVVRAEHLLGAVARGRFTLTGDHVALVGLDVSGSQAAVEVGGTGNRVLRNRFSGWSGVAVKAIAGSGAEIAYNELASPAPWRGGGDKTRIGIASNASRGGLHRNAHVHGNHLHDFPAKPDGSQYSSGQADALEICGAQQPISASPSGWIIERNLIQRHHQAGAAAIDIKCSGTTVRYNTLLDSPGARLDLRSGVDSILAGNWLERTGGIVVHGGYHRLLGNVLRQSAGIVLTAGNVPFDYIGPTRLPARGDTHQAAAKVLLSGNDAPWIAIGTSYDASFTHPAHDNTIEQFAGPVHYGLQHDTRLTPRPSAYVPAAIRQAATNVGPFARGGCP